MSNEPYNNIQLDRLVDGELTGNERRQLIESFDKRPEGWRRCALAFLEAQSWREELGQVARGMHSESQEPKSPATSGPQHNSSNWAAGTKWLALAASLLLAFGLGRLPHERSFPVAGNSQNGSAQVAKSEPGKAAPRAKDNDALTLYVRDDSGKLQPVRVPLVDAGTLDQQLGVKFQPGMPDTLREELQNRGYAVKSKRQYAPLWLENGNPMIVPVEDTKIVPVSESVNESSL